MTRIWRYVLKVDAGIAPCPQAARLSLCCCKPVIRRYAKVGDWVIGFVPKGLGLGKIAWAGRVSKAILLGDYQLNFPKRADAIYRRVDFTSEGIEVLEPLPLRLPYPGYHADNLSRSRDQRGRRALLFEPFWYWGQNAVEAPPNIAEMAHYHPGQSTKNSWPDRVNQLESWLRSVIEPGIHGRPRDPFRTKTTANEKRRAC
jgi:hypothetical protein